MNAAKNCNWQVTHVLGKHLMCCGGICMPAITLSMTGLYSLLLAPNAVPGEAGECNRARQIEMSEDDHTSDKQGSSSLEMAGNSKYRSGPSA